MLRKSQFESSEAYFKRLELFIKQLQALRSIMSVELDSIDHNNWQQATIVRLEKDDLVTTLSLDIESCVHDLNLYITSYRSYTNWLECDTEMTNEVVVQLDQQRQTLLTKIQACAHQGTLIPVNYMEYLNKQLTVFESNTEASNYYKHQITDVEKLIPTPTKGSFSPTFIHNLSSKNTFSPSDNGLSRKKQM